MSRLVRWAVMTVGVVGAVIALLAVILGTLAPTAAETWAWVGVECVGLLLMVGGLHAWIDWGHPK